MSRGQQFPTKRNTRIIPLFSTPHTHSPLNFFQRSRKSSLLTFQLLRAMPSPKDATLPPPTMLAKIPTKVFSNTLKHSRPRDLPLPAFQIQVNSLSGLGGPFSSLPPFGLCDSCPHSVLLQGSLAGVLARTPDKGDLTIAAPVTDAEV